MSPVSSPRSNMVTTTTFTGIGLVCAESAAAIAKVNSSVLIMKSPRSCSVPREQRFHLPYGGAPVGPAQFRFEGSQRGFVIVQHLRLERRFCERVGQAV